MILHNMVFALQAFLKASFIWCMAAFGPEGWQKSRAKRLREAGDTKDEEGKMTADWKLFKGAFDILYEQNFHINVDDYVPSDIDLVDLDSGIKVNLKSLCSTNVPLILNFGSCT